MERCPFQFHVVGESRVICKLVLYFLSQPKLPITLAIDRFTKAMCLSKKWFCNNKIVTFSFMEENVSQTLEICIKTKY